MNYQRVLEFLSGSFERFPSKLKKFENSHKLPGVLFSISLITLQQRIINTIDIDYFNSETHETTMTNILADKGICLTPGFFQDYTGEFAWIPFDCEEKFECYLCIHTNDKRESLKEFIQILREIYKTQNY